MVALSVMLKYCKKGKERCVDIYDRSKDNREKGRRVVVRSLR
jgi:hypothetical protein